MEEEKSVFDIISEIDKNILKQQEELGKYATYNIEYGNIVSRIKQFLRHRKQILKMNKKYGISFLK